MKWNIVLALLLCCTVVSRANVPVPADKYSLYQVAYSVVPFSKLGEAVTSETTAADIEKNWLAENKEGGPFKRDFAIVVFVHCQDTIPAFGQLRLWLSSKYYRDASVSAPTPKRTNVYVIDGGLMLLQFRELKKNAEWLSLEYAE